MDMLKMLLNDKYKDMFSSLTSSGFSEDQAKAFIPEAASQLMSSGNAAGSDASSILGNIDIQALAEKLGISSELVTTGLAKLLPIVTSATGGDDSGGLMGTINKFF